MFDYTIYCNDLMQVLPDLPEESVNLTVTSPPYNIGKEYENVMPLDEYIKWCKNWLRELYRVTTKDGALWLNLGYVRISKKGNAVPLAYLLWDQSPFYLNQEIIWNYGAGVSCKNMFSPRNEKWLWLVKDPDNYRFDLDAVRDPNVKYPNQKKNGKLKCNLLGKNPGDVWQIPKVTSGMNRSSKERTPHPAQFPLAVVERIIKACSITGDTILDPFMGSGITGVAAFLQKRKFIGIEIQKQYCDMAQKRIETIARKPEQLSLF